MGNDSEQKSNLVEDYIPFEAIQESLGISDQFLFKKYLQEIFVDLSTKVNNSKNKYISRITFYDYVKLPIFISEKLYNSFSIYENQIGLTENEFVNGFFYLYSGTFQDTAKIVFNILDFDKDGIIHKEDVKIILSYLPLNDESESIENNNDSLKKIFRSQMKSLEEIDELLNITFDKFENEMNFEQYIDIIQNEKSDVYLQIILFLYQKKPFNHKNIESLKLKYKEKDDEEYKQKMRYYNRKRSIGGTVKIKSPNQMSLLSPTITFLKRKFSLIELNNNEELNNQKRMSSKITSINNIKDLFNKDINLKKSNLTNKSSGISTQSESDIQIQESAEIKNLKNNLEPNNKNISFVRYNNEVEIKKEVKQNNNNIKEIIDNSKQRYSSPTKYLQEKTTLDNLALMNKKRIFETNLVPINEEKNDDGDKKEEDNDIIEEEKNIKYENWVYKLTENKSLKKFYLVLLNKDLYYYKDKEKQKFLGLHNLSGCYLQEKEELKTIFLDNKNFYIFEINFHNKSKIRKYYTPDINIWINFLKAIKEAIGYINFNDHYELKEVIGKGKFGVVNLGIHKKTQKQVAIKIINKDSIKTSADKELVKIEIDILKLCHHQNIVRLLDHLENLDYIFIIMEYIEGGTLGQYLKKNNFNFTERQAANMIYQIALGVKYLHSYGIVHRDLKPDNIMITQPNDLGVLKIMDFGLSKILSTQEKMVDGFGTLSYVAPEVLLRSPYNKEVDIWSLGVILYYILCGHLPFKGNKEMIIAEKIVNDELEFNDEEWDIRSQKVKDLISNCMKKDPGERITIDEFLNHPWFKKNKKQKFSI